MQPRRKNKPCGPTPSPNQNVAFDQQLVVGMTEDLKRRGEALTQDLAQRENPSQDFISLLIVEALKRESPSRI
jgi:hypothetical protein